MNGASAADFASAAMVRVLVRGMQALGLRPPEIAPPLRDATVPLDLKRAVVQAALEQGGLAALPLLGRGVHDLAMEPTHLALTRGRSAGAMLVRWQRLERYIHSQHRIRLHELGTQSASLSHTHKNGGPAPWPAEDLVVCGVLCALLEANGLTSVTASAAGVPLYPQAESLALQACAARGQTGTWQLRWKTDNTTTVPLDLSVSWALVAPPTWSHWAQAVGDRVARHLPALLPLDEVASELCLSRRTFQRQLAHEGLRYPQLVSEVRFRLAGWHLLHTDLAIAEIGFLCGYADQAHLTRTFNRHVGVPPARYRSLFAGI